MSIGESLMGSQCPGSSCNKTGVQCLDITAPLTLTPTAVIGSIVTTCQGNPTVVCEVIDSGSACTVTLTQKICVSIPVQFGVSTSSSEPTIACGGETCICR